MPEVRVISGIEVMFVRRRYGSGATTRFFTWLHWKNSAGEWRSYGDPWPSSTIPKDELQHAIAGIMAQQMAEDINKAKECGGNPGIYAHVTPRNPKS
jgi:hypothetical protein